MTFAKATLKNGEPRNDYIRKRRAAGAALKDIVAEINDPSLFNGAPGKPYTLDTVKQAVYVEKKPEAKARPTVAELDAILNGPEVPVTVNRDGSISAKTAPHPAADFASDDAPSGDSLLSADEIAAIRAQARAEILAELKAAKKKELLAKAKGEIRGEMALAAGTNEPMVTITINLAAYVDRIHLNQPYGPVYMHGRTYTVPISTAQVLMSQMYESWKHEDMRKGIPVVEKTSRNIVLSGKSGAVLSGNLAGLAGF